MLLAVPLSAQNPTCEICNDYPIPGYFAVCEQAPSGVEGYVGCTVHGSPDFLMWCEFSGGACMTYTPPPPPPVDPCQDGYQSQACSPVVINLANGAWNFVGESDAVRFDLDADGTKELRAWPARGSRIAFLVADWDRSGAIDDGSEWFGDWRPAGFPNTETRTGYGRLDDFDTDHDGAITPFDWIWSHLQLWVDENHDGISQSGELSTLDANEIEEIGFAYHETARADKDGVAFRYQSYVRIGGRREPTYDVLLKRFD